MNCRVDSRSKSDHLRISDVLSVNSTTRTWQQVFTDGPQRTACPQAALHVRAGLAFLTPVEGSEAIGASEGLAALASAPLGAPSHRVRRTVERPRRETTQRGHMERPHGETTQRGHVGRPHREVTWRGHAERSHGEATQRGHVERPHGEATWRGHVERPCREVTWRGVGPETEGGVRPGHPGIRAKPPGNPIPPRPQHHLPAAAQTPQADSRLAQPSPVTHRTMQDNNGAICRPLSFRWLLEPSVNKQTVLLRA